MEPVHQRPPPSAFGRSPSGPGLGRILSILLGLALVGGVGYWAFRYWPIFRAEPPAKIESIAAPDAGPVSIPEPELVSLGLPNLDQSDEFVRSKIASIGNPTVKKWAANPSVVRRWVAGVASASEGDSPRAALAFLAPEAPFEVDERKEGTFISPDSYRRYDALANAVDSVNVAAAMNAFKNLEPLCDRAWKEIAPPGTHFRQSAIAALARVAATPDAGDEPKLVPKGGVWAFADPKLEELGPLEKHVLRLGPANAARMKAKARELREALALPR